MSRGNRVLIVTVALLACCPVASSAHDGPPYPIVTDHISGPFRVSVWTDPDTTDDGTPGGQFWIIVQPARGGDDVLRALATRVTVRPLQRSGPPVAGIGVPADGNLSRQFAAVVMDHEGRFAVRVDVESAAGSARVEAEVDATYDLRPQPVMLLVYLLPFVMAGFLWTMLLVRRRRAQTRGGDC